MHIFALDQSSFAVKFALVHRAICLPQPQVTLEDATIYPVDPDVFLSILIFISFCLVIVFW